VIKPQEVAIQNMLTPDSVQMAARIQTTLSEVEICLDEIAPKGYRTYTLIVTLTILNISHLRLAQSRPYQAKIHNGLDLEYHSRRNRHTL